MTTLYDGKIYGPYLRSDGRKHIIVVFKDKTRKTVSYPKYLMECHLGRLLEPWETVDHIDKNKSNDEISNLQILSRAEHCAKDAIRLTPITINCPVCGTEILLMGKKLHDAYSHKDRGHSGPYCSKSCAGKSASLGITENVLPSIRSYS